MLSIPTTGVFSLCDALDASGRRADAEGQHKVKSEGRASAEETKDCSHHHRFLLYADERMFMKARNQRRHLVFLAFTTRARGTSNTYLVSANTAAVFVTYS